MGFLNKKNGYINLRQSRLQDIENSDREEHYIMFKKVNPVRRHGNAKCKCTNRVAKKCEAKK